jgi:hypothetical protein
LDRDTLLDQGDGLFGLSKFQPEYVAHNNHGQILPELELIFLIGQLCRGLGKYSGVLLFLLWRWS